MVQGFPPNYVAICYSFQMSLQIMDQTGLTQTFDVPDSTLDQTQTRVSIYLPTPHLSPYTSPVSLHLTSLPTPHLSPYTSPLSLHLTCLPTPHLSPYTSSVSLHLTCLPTPHLSPYTSPVSLHLTCLPTPHLSPYTSPLSLHLTSLPTPHLSPYTSPVSLHLTCLSFIFTTWSIKDTYTPLSERPSIGTFDHNRSSFYDTSSLANKPTQNLSKTQSLSSFCKVLVSLIIYKLQL